MASANGRKLRGVLRLIAAGMGDGGARLSRAGIDALTRIATGGGNALADRRSYERRYRNAVFAALLGQSSLAFAFCEGWRGCRVPVGTRRDVVPELRPGSPRSLPRTNRNAASLRCGTRLGLCHALGGVEFAGAVGPVGELGLTEGMEQDRLLLHGDLAGVVEEPVEPVEEDVGRVDLELLGEADEGLEFLAFEVELDRVHASASRG